MNNKFSKIKGLMNVMKRTIKTTIVFLVLFATILSIVAVSSEAESKGKLYFASTDFDSVQPRTGLVIATHGWIEKGQNGWPEEMANAIQEKVDPSDWLCGYFDWADGARTINATSAAKYARDIAGPSLAKQILKLDLDLQHIHLIGHSTGCWAISEAAKILAKKTKADIHLTFFDAYVSVFWEESSLGCFQPVSDANCWAEHYYTRDYTLGWTQYDLTNAHNVDVTAIDQLIKDHNFPWQWYYATITGEYPTGSFCDDDEIVIIAENIKYGFARSKEAADPNGWSKTLKLPKGNKAVRFKKAAK
ncbi:hypothetical protein ACFL1G_03390 [Planctomycetota bacterium]